MSRPGRIPAWLATAVALLLVALAGPAGAEEYSPWRKAGRGFASLTTGWLEVPGRMVAEQRERGILPGLAVGLAKGLGVLAPRHLLGVYELLTWPIALPRRYEPLMRPEFPWQHFEEPAPPRR
jgi:putative exosortase-associated protein (TIGR04073 family)